MNPNTMRRILGLSCALVTASVISAAPLTPASGEVPRKLKRQIAVMEKVVNDVLLESPHILVYSQDPAHGVYLEEFGVLFLFEASLVENDRDEDWGRWWKEWGKAWSDNFRVERDGNKIIIHSDPDDDDEDHDHEDNGDDSDTHDHEWGEDMSAEDWEAWQRKREATEARSYAEGKEELTLSLLDYGDTLTGLADDQWVGIAAFLKNADFFAEKKISRLILKAKMGDLRAYAEGTLTEEQMLERIIEEEY